MRKAKLLTKVKSAHAPRVVVFLDTETFSPPPGQAGEHVFRLGWVCVRRERRGRKPTLAWTPLDSPKTFWALLASLVRGRQRIYLLAHKVVYDLWVLGGLDGFRRRGYLLGSGYANSRVVILRFRRGETTLVVLDTLNFFPGPLAKWGAEIGHEKLKVDLWTDSDAEISLYCHRDVEILVRLWEQYLAFVRRNRLGGVAVTVASQAFRAFRHRFMSCRIYIHDRKKVTELEREAYYGGRTECWAVGVLRDVLYTVHDVNSMYAYVMREGTYPTRLIGVYRGCTLEGLESILSDREAVARVRVWIKEPLVPMRQGDRTIYPVGRFTTTLASPELRLLLQTGGILSIPRVAVYERGEPFTKYVDTLYALRKRYAAEGRILWADLLKLMLNGLYGKFGQRSEDWKHYPNTMGWPVGSYRFTWHGRPGVQYAVCMGHEVWVRVGIGESLTSFCAIAATVTSYARVKLWEYLELAGRRNVVYADTDSIATTPAGTRRLAPYVNADRLGALKVQSVGVGGHIYAPKDYIIGYTRRTKGVTAAAIDMGDNKYLDSHWPGFWGLLAAGRGHGYATGQVLKVLERRYVKGTVLADGRVEPFRLEEVPPPAAPPPPSSFRQRHAPP